MKKVALTFLCLLLLVVPVARAELIENEQEEFEPTGGHLDPGDGGGSWIVYQVSQDNGVYVEQNFGLYNELWGQIKNLAVSLLPHPLPTVYNVCEPIWNIISWTPADTDQVKVYVRVIHRHFGKHAQGPDVKDWYCVSRLRIRNVTQTNRPSGAGGGDEIIDIYYHPYQYMNSSVFFARGNSP